MGRWADKNGNLCQCKCAGLDNCNELRSGAGTLNDNMAARVTETQQLSGMAKQEA